MSAVDRVIPPYFNHLIERFHRGDASRSVHLGYWDTPDVSATTRHRDSFAAAQSRLDQLVIDLASLQDGQAVLDVGCGFGGTLARIADAFSGMELTGVNVDARQLAICDQLRPIAGNTFGWREADACALPFDDGTFDRVLCVEAMFHFSSRRAFFAEAARVLRAGGLLVGTDIVIAPAAVVCDTADWPVAATLQGGFAPWPDVWSEDADHGTLAAAAGLTGGVKDITWNVFPSHHFTAPPEPDAGDEAPGRAEKADAAATGSASVVARAARMLRWLHERSLLRYVCFRFEKPATAAGGEA
jgi:SAM-dependent methyltransferase